MGTKLIEGTGGQNRKEGGISSIGEAWNDLPHDVIRAILRQACRENALPTAAYASCVSRAWRVAIRSEPDVWRNVDLSYGWCKPTDEVVAYFCGQGITFAAEGSSKKELNSRNNPDPPPVALNPPPWRAVQSLNLQSCNKLTDDSLRCIASCCPLLRHLDLSDCGRKCFTGEALVHVAACCPLDSVVVDRGDALRGVGLDRAIQVTPHTLLRY
jgi:F-box/leucine-rich repeat protein 6